MHATTRDQVESRRWRAEASIGASIGTIISPLTTSPTAGAHAA
jgi:hypothetical protein